MTSNEATDGEPTPDPAKTDGSPGDEPEAESALGAADGSATGPTADSAESEDEKARAHLGASSGIDKKRAIIGGIIAVVFLAIVFVRVIPQFGDYSGALETLQAMTWSDISHWSSETTSSTPERPRIFKERNSSW